MHPCLRISSKTTPKPWPGSDRLPPPRPHHYPGNPYSSSGNCSSYLCCCHEEPTESVVQMARLTLAQHVIWPWKKVKKALGWPWKRPVTSKEFWREVSVCWDPFPWPWCAEVCISSPKAKWGSPQGSCLRACHVCQQQCGMSLIPT